MPVNATGESQCSQGEMVTRGHPHPPAHSFPQVAAWTLRMLAQPARGGGENQGAKRQGWERGPRFAGLRRRAQQMGGRLLGVPPRL